MTNWEKHQYLRQNVEYKLLDALDALRHITAIRSGLDHPDTLRTVEQALRTVQRQMKQYETTV